jgi:hypothetical protein
MDLIKNERDRKSKLATGWRDKLDLAVKELQEYKNIHCDCVANKKWAGVVERARHAERESRVASKGLDELKTRNEMLESCMIRILDLRMNEPIKAPDSGDDLTIRCREISRDILGTKMENLEPTKSVRRVKKNEDIRELIRDGNEDQIISRFFTLIF